ncbi:MAG: phage protease, partial [Proteobacteria bacterium]|nr:phage protease [Pseudomonadota bacterium]
MKHQFVALNVELPNGAPEWVELIPAGPNVQGVDGRSWYSGPEQVRAVLAAFADRGLPYPIDWEHSTEYRAPKGEEAPAAAWIVELADRQGALWGRVEWTPRARQQVENREYRYLSPVFAYTKTDRKIQALLSAGLTNTPNLRLTALNRNQARNMEDDDMKKALCRLLGLPETATDQDIEAAVAELKGDTGRAANR